MPTHTITYNTDYSSNNFSERLPGKTIDTIVLHTTATPNTTLALIRLTGKIGGFLLPFFLNKKVSAHYLIAREQDKHGQCLTYGLVDEEKKSWGCGLSQFSNEEDLNQNSINIEIVCAGKDNRDAQSSITFSSITEEQMRTCARLIADIQTRHSVPKNRILTHEEITLLREKHTRKYDPYPSSLFKVLAEEKVAIGYDENQVTHYQSVLNRKKFMPSIRWVQEGMKEYGLVIKVTGVFDQNTRIALSAFQKKFRPESYAGRMSDSKFSTNDDSQFFKKSAQESLDNTFFAIFASIIEQVVLEKKHSPYSLQTLIDQIFPEERFHFLSL